MITSSEEAAQAGFEMVQRKVTEAPITKPVTPEVADPGVVIVAVPATTVHNPVPTAAAFPAKEVEVTLHKF